MSRLVAFFLLVLPLLARAQPQPTLTAVPPLYLRQGESRDVPLTGQHLTDAKSVALTGAPGVTATLAPDKPTPHLHITATADAPLGTRELRVITPQGVTRPLPLTVGTLPLTTDQEPNNAFDSAQPLTLPTCLTGRIDSPGDADVFRFTAESGQHLLFDVHAARLNSPLEPVLTIHDAAGRELPHADEFHAGDPLLVFDVPTSGAYFLQVRDMRYRGGSDFAYRIDAGALPYVEALLPASAPAGEKVELTALGHNLQGAARLTLDLTSAPPGERPVRFTTAQGPTNELPFLVTARPSTTRPTTTQPTTRPAGLTVPADLTAVIAKPDAENAHAFTVTQRQPVTLAITARRLGSPLDALLTLRTAKGDLIEQANGAGEAEARISRPLDPGQYVAAVRDLTFAGGPSYAYRLTLSTGTPPPDFLVRLLPDAIRVPRNGHAKLWCDVTRTNGFKGPITLSIEGAPPGVTPDPPGAPVSLDDTSSGTFTLSAAPDAPLGTWPIKVVARSGNITRTAEPELSSRVVNQAYLTVTEPAPITLEAPATPKPEQVKDYRKQIAAFKERLAKPDEKLTAAQAAWEAKTLAQLQKQPADPWTVLEAQKLTATGATVLKQSDDGAITAAGPIPETDTYTLVAKATLKTIAAIRLEALSDDALPGRGPGRAPNGNFVVKFAVTAADKPVTFKSATATFAQANYPAGAAVGVAPGTGWAISPHLGATQVATFIPTEPLTLDPAAPLTFTFTHPFGNQHVLGRFRISVTADPKNGVDTASPLVPPAIAALLKTPADDRTPEQIAKLADYYRTIAPELAATRQQIADLQSRIDAKPLSVARNQALNIPVTLTRAPDFKGEVQVTLEGFSRGRDPTTMLPTAITRNLQVTPLTLKPAESTAKLAIRGAGNAEPATRLVVLRADVKIGPDTWTQYSPAFPLTLTEK